MFSPIDRVVRLLQLPMRHRQRFEPRRILVRRSAAEALAQVAHELRQPLSVETLGRAAEATCIVSIPAVQMRLAAICTAGAHSRSLRVRVP
jgi:hypothetical protein